MEQHTLTRIFFVRHAQPDFECPDDNIRPLTAEGAEDAKQVTAFFADKQIDAFYCSPYKRSHDTIAGAAAVAGLPIHTDVRLRERSSAPGSNNREMITKRWADFSWHEEGGEALGEVQARNMAALTEILQKNPGKTIVIGTHGTALSTILNYYDPTVNSDAFFRIIDWMPYVIELDFEGEKCVGKTEHLHIEKEFKYKKHGSAKPVILVNLDWHNYEVGWDVISRKAVRGIIRDEEGHYMLMQSEKYGEFKFPGGGMEEGEDEKETLIREVLEETGHAVLPESIKYFGETIEKKKSFLEENTLFEQRSIYYFCQVKKENVVEQALSDNELALGLGLKFVDINEAIAQNKKVKETVPDWLSKVPWTERDLCVMEILASMS